ncbi:hypothetical protein EMPS_09490 [Entomortierella parvispora]|uniref:Uncharacterized protein n=1 Tax=Entomortierella parvispora TaxID=205924 RepID=A0A9P3HIA8_9FUNG|nr:hypothetical protein EMPS_09490 [Entomortierella parvispora]
MASSISVPHHPSSNQKGLSQISDHNNSHDRVIAPTTIEATTVQDEKSDWTDDEDENDDRGQEPGLEAMTKKKGLFFRKGFRFSRNTSSNNSTSSLGSFLSTQSARFLNNKTPSKTLPTPATTAPATASSSSSSSFLPKKKKQKSKKMSIVAPVPAPVPQCPRMGGEYEEVFDHGHNISVPIVPQTSYSSPRAAVSPTPPICQLDHIVVDVNSKGQELRLPMTVCIRSLPPPPLSPPPPRPAEADDDEDDEDDEDEDEFGMNAQRNEAYAQTRLRALREHQMVLVELMTVLMERERLAGQGSKDPRRSTRLMYSGKRSNNTTTVGSPTPSERYSLMSTTLISPDDLILLNTENALEETRVSSGRREENDGGKESSLTPCKCQLRRIRRRQKREEAARAYLTMVLDLWQMDQNMCHWLSRYIRTIRRVHRSLAYIQNCVALSKPWPEAIEKEDELLHGDDNALDCDPAKGGVTMDELERVGILQTNLLNRIFSRPKVPAASASATSVAASVDRFGADSETVLPKEDERQRMETITRLDRERQKQQPQNELNISTTSRLRRSIRIPRSRSRKSTATPSPLNTPTVNIPVPSVNSTFVASLSTPAQTVPSVSVVGSLPSLETGSIAGLALSKPLPPLPPITASAAATKPFPDPAFVALGDESSSCCMVTRSSSPYPSPSIPSSPSMPVLVPLVIQSSTTSIGSSTSLKNSAAAVDSPPAVLSPPGLIVTSPTIVRRGKSKKLRNGLPFSSFSRRHPTLRRYHQQQVLFPTPTMRSQLGGSSGGLGESCSSVALARESSFPLSELELSVLVGHHLQTLHAANRFLEEFNLQSENASSVMTQFWRAKEVYERWLALFSRKKRQSAAASSSLPQQQQYQQEHLQQQWLRRRQERLSLQHQQLQEKQAQQQLKVQQHQLKLLQQYRELQEQQLQEQIQQQHLQHLQQQQQQQQQGGLARRFTRRSRRATLMATKNTHGGSRSSRSTIMTTTTTTTTASRRARQKPSKTNMTLETKQK